MIGLIIFIGYTIAGVATAWAVGRAIVRHDRDTSGDGLAISAIGGLGAGFVWPLAITTMLLMKLLRRDFEVNDPQMRKRRLDERERRIKELERELGIGDQA